MLSRLSSFTRYSLILFSLTGAVTACDSETTDGPLAVSLEPTIYASDRGEVAPDVSGAASAELLINGASVIDSEDSPFKLPFSTGELAEGEHEIAVIVRSETGGEERASARLIIDRDAPALTVIEPEGDSAFEGAVEFAALDASPLRMIRLTVRDHAAGSAAVFTCTEVPTVTFRDCEDLEVHLIVQDAATNRSIRNVEHKGTEGGRCVTSVSSTCLPYRQ